MKKSAQFQPKACLAGILSLAVILIIPTIARAASFYWSGDGSTLGGAGAWDTTAANWAATDVGPFTTVWNNANNDTAILTNAPGANTLVTLGASVAVGGLRFEDAGINRLDVYQITSAATETLTFGTGGSIYVNSGPTTNAFSGNIFTNQGSTISAVIAGSGTLTKTGPGVLVLTTNNSFSGAVKINEGYLAVGSVSNPTADLLTNVTSITISNGATLGAWTNTVINAPIIVASGGTAAIAAAINPLAGGATTTGKLLDLKGGISGNGNVLFKGVNATAWYGVVQVTNCTYTGSTLMTCSDEFLSIQGLSATVTNNNNLVVRLAGDNALPTTTVLTMDGNLGTGSGRFCDLNLNGKNQTLAGLNNIPRTLRNQRVVNTAASASALLTINNSIDSEFSGLLGGSGGSLGAGTVAGNNFSLVKSGIGKFTLSRSGGNGYTNGTSINGGILMVSNATASATTGATGPGPLNINSGGTFAGAGIINSATTNNAGGTLSPGGTIAGPYGTLIFSNNVVMQAGSTNIFEVDGSAPQNDQIILGSAGGIVTYGGVLKVVPSGSFTLGQTFTLFSGALATNASNFGSIVGSPGSGKAFFFTNGVLSVVTAPSAPSPVTLTNSLSGSVLSLSWPAGQGWRLQAQTNALSTGLSTNWTDATSSAVSSTNITVDSAKPTVFYRLVYP